MAGNMFGGLLGQAEKALKERKSNLDKKEEETVNPKPKKEEDKKESRPPMSRKWTE